ncbi:Stress-response A/B barrel domain-containing protein HS1 [Vitis vinifera]|uniref:Stress-response A/B barrel domain-containing protein HS1 n=1 Tax=Vitis vinifera TaxID=29760 RepID=A0A438KKX8_VITVI|nr:Stress-response A/B barrel domain-containing protein HS1 [Vitis vinifera]
MEEGRGKGSGEARIAGKFKDSTPPTRLRNSSRATPTLGKDVSIENMHQGFTHVFESTFESVEGMAEYVSHPAHVEAANRFLPHLEKVIVLDYKPTAVHL